MTNKSKIGCAYLWAFLLPLVAAAAAFAGQGVVGLVAGSVNASVGGETILPNTTLFSGDRLQVNDGVAVVALGGTSRMIFGRDTEASFRRDSGEVTINLRQGDVSLFHAENTTPVRVKVGEVSVVPLSGSETRGEVAAGNGEVRVTAKGGRLRVEGNGQVINVAKGETITLSTKASALQSVGGSSVAKPHILSRQSEPSFASIPLPEAVPSGDALSVPPIGLAQGGNAAIDASKTAPNAPVAAASTPGNAPAPADTIGRALNARGDSRPTPSPHTP